MAEISVKDGKFSILLSEREFKELELDPNKEYEIAKAKKGLCVIIEKGEKKAKEISAELDKRIFNLVRKKSLSERVVGKFEKLLNNKELVRFNHLVKEGKIEKFKLSEKYKKAVYRVPLFEGKETANFSLKKDGFVVLKNDWEAKRISEENYEKIKKGKIRGIKSFDGSFYVINSDKFTKCEQQLADYLKKKKNSTLEEIVSDNGMQKELVKVVCEFMKENGDVAEKRRGKYSYIE